MRKAIQKCLPWRKTTRGSGHERKSTSFVENTNLCQFRPRYWIIWIPLGIWCHINHLRSLDSHQNSLGRVKAHRQNQIIPQGWQDATNSKAKPRNHFSSIITACSFLLCGTYTAEVSYWSPHQGDWWLWSSISRPINKNSYFTRIRLKDQCRTLTIGISDRPRKMVFNPQDSNQRECESSGVKWRPHFYDSLDRMDPVIPKVVKDNEPRRASDRSRKSWFLGDYQSARNSSNSGQAT